MIAELRFKLALLCWWIDDRMTRDPNRIGFFEWLGFRLEAWDWAPWNPTLKGFEIYTCQYLA